jgi:hypothetical protein
MLANEENPQPDASPKQYLPVILTVLSLFLMVGFQTYQAIRDRSTLEGLRSSQEQSVQEGIRLRQHLEALAGKTAQLAADGDAGARAVVEEMRRQGVNLTLPKQ